MTRPTYRLTFDSRELLQQHPPQFHHAHKRLLFELAYPDGTAPSAALVVTRWPHRVPGSLALPDALATTVQADFYDYRPAGDSGAVEWHVNFADPELFAAYGAGVLAQDEMQVAEHPILGSVREALAARDLETTTLGPSGPTPILVRNVERRLAIATSPDAAAGRPMGIYGGLFAVASPEVVRRATTVLDPPTTSHIIAMSALPGGSGAYTADEITLTLSTAMTAFAAARQESTDASGAPAPCVVHSGFWGCGVFGGDRTLMIVLQTLAARAAGIDGLVLHTGDAVGAAQARRALTVSNEIVARCGPACRLSELVADVLRRGYRWGAGDGN